MCESRFDILHLRAACVISGLKLIRRPKIQLMPDCTNAQSAAATETISRIHGRWSFIPVCDYSTLHKRSIHTEATHHCLHVVSLRNFVYVCS